MNNLVTSNRLVSMQKLIFCCVSVFLVFLLLAKENKTTKKKEEANTKVTEENSKNNDLDKILERKTLRIISPVNSPSGLFLPRSDSPMDKQIASVKAFAESIGVEAEMIPTLSFKDMLPTLVNGNGDIIVANLTVTEERKEVLDFSTPIDKVQEVILVSKSNEDISITKDLSNKSLLLDSSSTFWKRGLDFKKRFPSIKLIEQGSNLSDETIIDLVANQQYDATIRDSNIAEMYLNYRDDIRIAYKLSGKQDIALGLRKGSSDLKKALDLFLKQRALETSHIETAFGDVDAIKRRGVLRILLRNNASSYFYWRGQLMGFEYDMAKAYARHLKVRLAVFVPKDRETEIEWLNSGKIDFAAGFLQATPEWTKKGIVSSLPYHQAFAHIVVQTKEKGIFSARDLDGRTVVLPKKSVYWEELKALRNHGIDIELVEAPKNIEIEEIIQKVGDGEYDITIADEHYLNIELANNVAVKSAFTFGDQKNHTLAVRKDDSKLLESLNQFIKRKKDGKQYSRLYQKYFSNKKRIRRHLADHTKKQGEKTLSKYDKVVQKYSSQYGFDWRFISAQMFQESRFDPNAISHAGAIGLMQIMPATGKQLGFSLLETPENNIHAGVKYMKWLYDKFDDELPEIERIRFTLASYNAGLGHVLDARLLAQQKGLNKDIWYDNVEKAMLLLSKKKYAKRARFGYVRGSEPVGYVRSIKEYYANFINIVPDNSDMVKDSTVTGIIRKQSIKYASVLNH